MPKSDRSDLSIKIGFSLFFYFQKMSYLSPTECSTAQSWTCAAPCTGLFVCLCND
jgi:hypothetical protein